MVVFWRLCGGVVMLVFLWWCCCGGVFVVLFLLCLSRLSCNIGLSDKFY